jgi:hypothetical protein
VLLVVAAGLLTLAAGCADMPPEPNWVDWDDYWWPGGNWPDVDWPSVYLPGDLSVVVMWPEAESGGAEVRGMPPGSDLVRVTVTGSGIGNRLRDERTRSDVTDGQARFFFDDVISGPDRTVLAEAIDTGGWGHRVLASRRATVTVPEWTFQVDVHMDMALEQVLSVSPTLVFFWDQPQSPSQWTPRPVSVRNAGGGTLTWSTSADQPWISVSPSSGTDDGIVEVGVNPDELPPWDPGDPAPTDVGWVTVDAGGLAARIAVRVHRET